MAHILIADDDDLIAEVIGDALAAAGHPSRRVPSAEAAWDSLHAHRADLLLLDLDMPGMPGPALLARLRGSPLFYDLPVVILTAMRRAVEGGFDEEEAIRAGAQDFLRKPFEPAVLVARIEAAIAGGVSPFSPGWSGQDAGGEDVGGIARPGQRHPQRPRRA